MFVQAGARERSRLHSPLMVDQHKRYERRMALWLLVTYVLIGILTAALVLYAAVGVGWRPRARRGR